MVLPYSPTTQVVVGGTAGYTLGWISRKIGKTALVLVGTAAIMIPLAEQSGYLHINWKKVEKDAKNITKKNKKDVNTTVNSNLTKIDVPKLVQRNPNAMLSLLGGFILGLAL